SQPSDTKIPSQLGAAAQGKPDPSLLPPEMRKYANKPWGELPGELRTKIIQDMKAEYGEDYARIIKLYFEQIADAKKAEPRKPAGSRREGRPAWFFLAVGRKRGHRKRHEAARGE